MEVNYCPNMRHRPVYCWEQLLSPHCYAVSSYISPYNSCILHLVHPVPLHVGQYYRPGHIGASSSSPPKHGAYADRIAVRWTLPKHGVIKLNFDGGVSHNKAGCGYIVRDEYSSILLAGCDMVANTSVLEAELSGVLNGLKKVVQHYPSMKKIWIEGDSAIVISFLKRFNPIEMTSWPILQEIQKLLEHFVEVKFSHIYREGNQSADYLAGLGKEKQCHLFWTVGYPDQLMRFVQRDITMVFYREMRK